MLDTSPFGGGPMTLFPQMSWFVGAIAAACWRSGHGPYSPLRIDHGIPRLDRARKNRANSGIGMRYRALARDQEKPHGNSSI